MRIFILIVLLATVSPLLAQTDRWQQAVDYKMTVNLDVKTHRFTGIQELRYTNNSPDTLKRVFYHLYFNAFQPGSMMDIRSLNIQDPSRKIADRIAKLSPGEVGYLKPLSLNQNGDPVQYKVVGTVLEVDLSKPILPKSSVVFNMEFAGQVPVQIRRSGRNNSEGIDYSMAQWYPKMSEYDYEGWHANPYIAREFYGVWGDYDVRITIDKNYVVAASGVLQNGNEIGYGYEHPGTKVKARGKTLTYHFKSHRVHDFMWAADRDYVHKQVQVPEGPVMHYFYQEDSVTRVTWPKLMEVSPKMVTFMNKRFGTYPYPVFNVIQGGDGGMEYPMSTLILGRGSLNGLISVTIHEMFHSWYQGVLGSNESLYPWLDEGFTSYASTVTKAHLAGSDQDPFRRSYEAYYWLAKSGKQEPMTTHSDHYHTNIAYSVAAYSMGSMVPVMLTYIMGNNTFEQAFRRYYNTWQFKHPNETDFKRVMEKESGLELDWFFNDWLSTTKQLDYAVKKVEQVEQKVEVTLASMGQRHMPVEVVVTFKNGTKNLYYFPLRSMRANKREFPTAPELIEDWPWTHPEKVFVINTNISQIVSIEIDPSKRMGDIDQNNDQWINDKITGQ